MNNQISMIKLTSSYCILISILMVFSVQADFQPDPPRLRIRVSELCVVQVDGKEVGEFDGKDLLIRITKGQHEVSCVTKDNISSKTVVNAKENTDTFVFLEIDYINRFRKVNDVIIDAWTMRQWEVKTSKTKFTYSEAVEYCRNKKSKSQEAWSIPLLYILDDLMAATLKNINSCGKQKCSIHHSFKIGSPEVWTYGGFIYNFVTQEFEERDKNKKSSVLCQSKLYL